MSQIPVPFVDKSVDTSDPTSGMFTIVMLIAGMVVFYMSASIAQFGASRVNALLGNIIGFNPATGDDGENGVEVL
jgi:hypothetical protein